MHFKKLAIVSDTAMCEIDGKIFAFGPVVREIEYIEDLFDEITWIGFKRLDMLNDLSMQEIKSTKIKVVMLKNVGGKSIKSFLSILFQYPIMLIKIIAQVYSAEVVHTRAPSHPALIALIISFLFQKKIWWNKFAGNWDQKNPPYSYGFQRFLMKKALFCKVTINGFWDNQPDHCHSFENPCLMRDDLERGFIVTDSKVFVAPFVFCFIGRLEKAKGIERIIATLQNIPQEQIAKVHFVGDGKNSADYQKALVFLEDKVVFHGVQPKDKVHELLAQSHFLLLPSDSEGFPKVIAEAACYGVIPIVSNVGSIAHYITPEIGFLWDIHGDDSYTSVLQKAIATDAMALCQKALAVSKLANSFTFNAYLLRLEEKVLCRR